MARYTMVATLLVILTAPLAASSADLNPVLQTALRELETAQLQLRLYEQQEYPQKLRRFDREIELAQAHVEFYQGRIAEYEQFERFSTGNPLSLSLEEARLGLLQAELKLDELKDDRAMLIRHHPLRCRLFQLQVEAAQDLVDEARGR